MLYLERLWKNVRKHRYINLVTNDIKINKLTSKHHTTKMVFKNFCSNRNEKNKSKK